MLPFLKHRKISSVIIAKRNPEGNVEAMHEEGEQSPELMNAADSLISAVHMKDSEAVAEALKSAFEAMKGDV